MNIRCNGSMLVGRMESVVKIVILDLESINRLAISKVP